MKVIETIITIKAFVVRDTKFLLIQHEDGRWDAPGGRLNDGERVENALHREVREELGVAIASIDHQHPWVWNWQHDVKSRPATQNIIGIGYPCTLATDTFQTNPPEHIAHTWASGEELQNMNIVAGHKTAYLQWLKLHHASDA